MKKLLLIITLLVLIPSLFAASECVAYFTGQGCHDCSEMDRFTSYLQFKYPTFVTPRYEVYRNETSAATLQGYFDQYQVPMEKRGVPALFMGNMYFVGNQSTLQLVENEAVRVITKNCTDYNMSEFVGFTGQVSPVDVTRTVEIGPLTPAAIKDSFGISLLALLCVFVMLMAALRHKEKMVVHGALFIAGVIVVNVLFLLGVVPGVSVSTLYLFERAIGVVMVITGVGVLIHVARYPAPLLGRSQEAFAPLGSLLLQWYSALALGVAGAFLTLGARSVEVDTMQFLSTVRAMRGALGIQALYYSLLLVWLFIVVVVLFFYIKRFLEKHSHVRATERRDDVDRWIKHHHRFLNAVVAGCAVIVGIVFLAV